MSDINLGSISTNVVINIDAVGPAASAASSAISEMSQNIQVSVGSINTTIKQMADQTGQQLEAQRARVAASVNLISNDLLAAGGVIAAALGTSVKAAGDFDSALHEVSANAGLSASQFQAMRTGILSIAKDGNVRDTPAQLAKGLYNVVSAGFSGQKALDVLKESALGAAAGLTDTKTASDALTSVMNSGIKGAENERVTMDLLLKAVEQGKMHFSDLANNIGKVVPTAAALGVNLNEVLASVVLFTRQGQPVARATTDLLNVMNKLAHPAFAARQEFKELGIEYGVNALKSKGYTAVLDDVIKRTKGHTDVLMKLFPEMRAFRGAVESAQNSGKSFHEVLETLAHATDGQGQTMRAATEVNRGAEQQYAKMRQEITTLQTEIGDKLLPTAKRLMEQVRDLVKWFSGLSDSTKNNVVQIGLWSAGLLTALGMAGKLLYALAQMRIAYLSLAGAATAANAAQAGAGAAGAGGLLSRLGPAAGAGALAIGSGVVMSLPALVAGFGLHAIGQEQIKEGDANIRGNSGNPEVLALQMSHLAKLKKQLNEDPGNPILLKRIEEVQGYLKRIANPNGNGAPTPRRAAQDESEAARIATARAKAEADYAKSQLAKDPYPGADGKKKKKKDDDDEPDMGEIIAEHVKTATKSAPFKASCAFFVSEVLRQSGVAIKGSASVKDLWQQLIGAGAEEVSGSLQKGDILKFHGKNFGTSKDAEGKGNHTGIYMGDGKFVDSHDYNSRRPVRNLADYMKANPDADLKALRIGDTDDRTNQVVERRNEAIEKQQEKQEEAKEKAQEKARAAAEDEIALDIAKYEAARSDAASIEAMEQEAARKRRQEAEDEIALDTAKYEAQKSDLEAIRALEHAIYEDKVRQNQEELEAATWQQEVAARDRESQKEQAATKSPAQQAAERLHATLQNMRENVENILGGAFESLFDGKSHQLFDKMLQSFVKMLEQMAAKALALGIVNLLTGGAGGFLGGAGKGNGGFLSVFGFDDATNDKKAGRFGFDFARHFTGGMQDYQTKHARQGDAGRGAPANHVSVNIGEVHNHHQADVDKMTDMIAWKVQTGLSGRNV